MKITDHIKNAKGETLFSFELIPPVKGRNIQELYDNIDPLMEFKPPFIDVRPLVKNMSILIVTDFWIRN